jgi:hypothetical protein
MQINAYYTTPIVVPGYTYRNEKNIIDTPSDGSFIGSSEYFHEHVLHIKSHDTLKTLFGINYAIRSDFVPVGGEFYQNHRGQTLSIQAKMPSHLKHAVNGVLSHRKTDQLRGAVNEGKGENISGAIHYAGRFWENVLSQEISYGISSGHEPRREYIFIQVPTGQGHYTWIDDNNNGIQDLSEFYEARFEDEKNYAKIFVPTDQYIVAFSTDLNLRVRYEPPVAWQNSATILKSIARISGNSSIIYNTKTEDDNLWARLTPFPDGGAVSFRNSQRIQLFYNRSFPYGLEYNFLQSKRRQVLTSGFEEMARDISRLTFRMSIWEGAVFRINTESGKSESGSDYLSNRNFLISHKELMPELEWLPSRSFRIAGKLGWKGKNSEEQERNGKAVFRSAELGINGNAAGGRMIGLNLVYTKIHYNNPSNTFLEYEMLEAMRPGHNFTWRFRMQQDLVQGLRFSVNYDGRKSESGRAIHFGRVQLMAFF